MIKITEKYYIKNDDLCYQVCERSIVQSGKNKGEEWYGNATYHTTFHEALNNVIHRIQKDKLNIDETISLKQAVKLLVDVQKEFTDIVKGIENYD